MQFGNPQALSLLLAWPLLVAGLAFALRRRRRLAERIGQGELLDKLYPPSVRRWRRRRAVLASVAALLLIVAASRPQYGRIEQTLRAQGASVLIALDCSASMNAQDVSPSRIAAAKQSLKLLLNRLHGDRVGIVAFAGAAFLQCPMTLDRDMAVMVLDSLGSDSVGVQGTDLGEAIRVATRAFEHGAPEGGRALVLLTDGEDNEGKGVEAAKQAHEKGIVIDAIGIGSDRGAPIPTTSGGYIEETGGTKVNSRLRMDTLKQIAEETGGTAIDAGKDPGRAVDEVAGLIAKQQRAELDARKTVLYQDRFQWFLGPALILLLWLLLSRPEPTRVGESHP